MSSTRRLFALLSLSLLLAGVWTGPVAAQPHERAAGEVTVVHTEVPRAVVPDRIPVVPSPTSPARLLSERLDRTDRHAIVPVVTSAFRQAAPTFWATGVLPGGSPRLYDVLRVYRL